jgi:hypothetical protein
MPEKHDKHFYFDGSSVVPHFTGIETVDCPRCRFRIPVESNFVDYKRLYELQETLIKQQVFRFEQMLSEMADDLPEIKIYLHNKHCELKQMLVQLSTNFNAEAL